MAGAAGARAGGGPDGDGKLDGLARRQMAEIQRARLLAALAQVARERGAAKATVARVVARAGVSRRTFYEVFADIEECRLAALESALERVAARVLAAYERPGSWRERIRAGLVELLGTLEGDPAAARLLLVDSHGAVERALELRERVVDQLVGAVELGRGEPGAVSGTPALAGEAVVGAVLAVLGRRALLGGELGVVRLVGQLMSIVVLPYLGATAAREELELAVPISSRRARDGAGFEHPLDGAPIRLTYRTVRVLTAIEREPGASNRAVGEAAGIEDQGQISKLLGRLREAGLVENRAAAESRRGAANVWVLTAAGKGVLRGA